MVSDTYHDHVAGNDGWRRLNRRRLIQRVATAGASVIGARPSVARAASLARPNTMVAAQLASIAGGTLREGYDLDFSTLDPLVTPCCEPGMSALYESLITVSSDGDLEPQLAERWEVDDDAGTVTLTIREDARFDTGRPLDAMAVKEGIEALIDAATGSSLFTVIDRVDASHLETLVLTLKHPSYALLNLLSSGAAAIANQTTRLEFGEQYGRDVVDGTGPFTFEEWVPGSHLSVRRWEGYPGSIVPSLQNKGKAYLDRIRWETISDPAQRTVRIENGEIDTLRGPLPQAVTRLQANPDLNVIIFNEPSGYLVGLNFERTDLDFHDVRMRQAISAAIDRVALVQTLLDGQGEPLHGPVSSADPTYTSEVERFNNVNLDAVRRSFTELGWTTGADGTVEKEGRRLAFRLVTVDEPFLRAIGASLQEQVRQVGIDLSLDPVDRETFLTTVQGGADSYLHYYRSPVPTDAVVSLVGAGASSSRNWARSMVPAVDDAISAWRQAADHDDMMDAGKRFGLAVAEHLPVIPLINRNAIWVHRTNVHGWAPDRFAIAPRYNDVWLDSGRT